MKSKDKTKRVLGRGLSELISASALAVDIPGQKKSDSEQSKKIPIELIKPNKNQPRKKFSKTALEELSRSIAAKGVIQPLLVRKTDEPIELYEIVAGERRWRAAQMAKLHEIPVIVGSFSDLEVLEIAIIENIQREDLNPIEEALGFKQLQEAFSQTQEQLSEALGKSRSYIANALRLLALPKIVLDWIQDGSLSVGHARAIITLKNPSQLARKIVVGGLTVRETERLVRKFSKKPQIKKPANVKRKPADTLAIEKQLSLSTGFNITVNHKELTESGEVIISYDNLSDFDKLCELLS